MRIFSLALLYGPRYIVLVKTSKTATKTFKFYSDAGHGWLAVKRSILVELGCLAEITPYSYEKGATVYLEEDCDATTFVKAFKAKFGTEPLTVSVYTKGDKRSPIRSYPNFRDGL